MKEYRFMIIAGEVSGDMHAARLVKAIKERLPGAAFSGIGGDEMLSAGVELAQHVNDMAVMGLTEVVRKFGFFKRVFNQMLNMAREQKPHAVILVDYPGFNLRFAAKTHELGIKTIYYICPQVWAWNRSRIPKMARIVDRLITIFPFEQKYFSATALAVDFVGHPLVDEARRALAEPVPDLSCEGDPLIALLPGSRSREIESVLPAMLDAASLVEKKHPDAGFVIAAPSQEMADVAKRKIEKAGRPQRGRLQSFRPVAAGVDRENVAAGVDRGSSPARLKIITGNTRQVLRAARAAMVTSGTATLEAALMLCPMVITYKMAGLMYLLGKILIKVENIGIVNIVAEKKICPELIQHNATPVALAEAIDPLLENTPERSRMIKELKKVSQALGPGGAEAKAAELIIGELK